MFLAAEIAMVEAFGYSWLVRGTVRPGVALGMVAAVSVPTAGLLVWFTMVTSANPGRPLETAMSEVSALAGLVGLVVALGLLTMLHLRRGGTGLRLRERAGS